MSTPEFVIVCFLGCCVFCSLLLLIVLLVAGAIRGERPEPMIEVVPEEIRRRYREQAPYDHGEEHDERKSASVLYPPFGRDVAGTPIRSPRAVLPAGMTRTQEGGHRGPRD